MELAELEKKYKELGEEIERLKGQVGFKDDKIFLLSVDEYKKYADKIPSTPWWWLRSPGCDQNLTYYVYRDGWTDCYGSTVTDDYGCVRPALKHMSTKDKFEWLGATWIRIDENLYIAEMPIAMRRFDAESNDYETSEVRQFLLDWYKERLGEGTTV